jgi:hypothetical protein
MDYSAMAHSMHAGYYQTLDLSMRPVTQGHGSYPQTGKYNNAANVISVMCLCCIYCNKSTSLFCNSPMGNLFLWEISFIGKFISMFWKDFINTNILFLIYSLLKYKVFVPSAITQLWSTSATTQNITYNGLDMSKHFCPKIIFM